MESATGGPIVLRDELVEPLMELVACITGRQKEVDLDGNIIGESPYEINFERAHALFRAIAYRLEEWPKITGYPISQNLLKELEEGLNELKQPIESLSDSRDKNAFRGEWNQLSKYIASKMDEKDGSYRSTPHHSPAG